MFKGQRGLVCKYSINMDVKFINVIQSDEAKARRIRAQVRTAGWPRSPHSNPGPGAEPSGLRPPELLPTLFTRLAQRSEAFKQQEKEGPILGLGGTA